MTQKEEVDIVLKEYDALRKEIDERLKTTQINGIYSLLVVVGGVLAFGASHPDPTYVAFIPPVFIAILGVLVHGWKTLVEDTAREIAQVENKMYVITARPLLDHETALARDRNRKSPWPWAMRWVAILTLYTFLEWDMFVQMLRSQFPNDLFHRIESDCYPIRSPSVYDLYIQDVRIETARQTFQSELLDANASLVS